MPIVGLSLMILTSIHLWIFTTRTQLLAFWRKQQQLQGQNFFGDEPRTPSFSIQDNGIGTLLIREPGLQRIQMLAGITIETWAPSRHSHRHDLFRYLYNFCLNWNSNKLSFYSLLKLSSTIYLKTTWISGSPDLWYMIYLILWTMMS